MLEEIKLIKEINEKTKISFFKHIVSKKYIYSFGGKFLRIQNVNEECPIFAEYPKEIFDLILFDDKKESDELISSIPNKNNSSVEIKLFVIEKNCIKVKSLLNIYNNNKYYRESFYIYKINNSKILLYNEYKRMFLILNVRSSQIETKIIMDFNISKFSNPFLISGNFRGNFSINKDVSKFTNISKIKQKIIDKHLIKNIFPKRDSVISISGLNFNHGKANITIRVLNTKLIAEKIKISLIFPIDIAYNILSDSIYSFCNCIYNDHIYFVFRTMYCERFIGKCQVCTYKDNKVLCCKIKGKDEKELYDLEDFILKDNKIYYFNKKDGKEEQMKIINDEMFS